MEELKVLIGMVSDLPQMAIWVLVGFFAYKVVVIGSVFGLIKLFIVKFHSWAITPKKELKIVQVEERFKGTILGESTSSELELLLRDLREDSSYIHSSDVAKLRKAWNNREK